MCVSQTRGCEFKSHCCHIISYRKEKMIIYEKNFQNKVGVMGKRFECLTHSCEFESGSYHLICKRQNNSEDVWYWRKNLTNLSNQFSVRFQLNIGRDIPITRAQRIYNGSDVRGFKPVIVNFAVNLIFRWLALYSAKKSFLLWFGVKLIWLWDCIAENDVDGTPRSIELTMRVL